MNKKDFESLLAGVREMKAIRAGKKKPARVTKVKVSNSKQILAKSKRVSKKSKRKVSPKAIRRRLKLSQSQFALLLGVNVGTLRNWEQGVREPKGPAKALLKIAEKRPDAVLEALHG